MSSPAPRIDGQVTPLTGPVVRLDGNRGAELIVDVDPATVAMIGPKGVPMGDPGHCKFVNPLISEESASRIHNPIVRGFVKVSTGFLHVLDRGFNLMYDGVDTVDRVAIKGGLDHLTGAGGIQNDLLQSTVRWGERVTAITALATAYNYVSPRVLTAVGRPTEAVSARQALVGAGAMWRQTWPLATAIFLTATGLAADAKKGLDAIDPQHDLFKGEDRKYARWGSYAALFTVAALALNFPTKAGYRKIVAPVTPPTGAHPMVWWAGLAAATGYFGLIAYWDNASAQERILTSPLYNEPEGTGLYKPWKWQPDFLQGQTAAGYAIYWGLIGAAWAGLLSWQTKATGRVSKALFGYGSEVLAVQAGSREQAFIDAGGNAISRGLRGASVRLFTRKRATFTALSSILGLPMGVGLGQMMEKAMHYSSTTSTSGTPFRALVTGPLAAVGMTFNTAAYGYATAWGAYAFNMIPVNYSWGACSKMGENLFQSARVLADDYQSTTDPNDKRRLRTRLFQLYMIAYDNGNPDPKQNERAKIGALLKGAGIDAQAIADYVTRKSAEYAALQR